MNKLSFYFILFTCLFILYFIVSFILKKKTNLTKGVWFILILISATLRIYFFFEKPVLSDDIYRYYLDGKVISHRINPYQYPPNSKKLEFLQDQLTRKVNHPHMNTVYPPVSQVLFFLGYQLGGIKGIKFIFILFDLGIILILFLMLRARSQLPRIFIYALNPLVIFEFYGSVHTESATLFFLMLAIYLISLKKTWGSLISTVGAILLKYFGLFIAPFYYKKLHWKKITLSLLLLFFAFFFFWNNKIFKSLLIYQRYFEFNGFLYTHLKFIFKSDIARLICTLIFLSTLIIYWLKTIKEKFWNENDLIQIIFNVLSLYLFTTPTFHPWYFTLFIPLLIFHFKKSYLFFSGLIFLSYTVLFQYSTQKIWKENYFVLLLEYIPFIILLLYENKKLIRKRLRFIKNH